MQMAGNVAGDVVDKLLSAIGATAKKVKTTALTVKANKAQSTRLAERVETVAGFLTGPEAVKLANSSMRPQLESFHGFLQGCDTFIGKFGGKSWFSRIRSNKNHAEKFHQLNIDLDRYVSDFSLGLQVNIFSKLTPEDKRDAQLDQVEINQIITAHATQVPAPVLPPVLATGSPAISTPVRPPVQLAPSVHPNANVTGTARPPIPVRLNNTLANQTGNRAQHKNYYGQFGFFPRNNFMYNYQHPYHQQTFSRKRFNSMIPAQQFGYPTRMQTPYMMNPFYR